MKKLLLLFVLTLLSGCKFRIEEEDRLTSWKRIIPSSAVIIKSYDGGRWIKWKFENECFLLSVSDGGKLISMKVWCNE